MRHINELVTTALKSTATQERLTLAEPVPTPMLENSYQFQTLNDPQLLTMARQAYNFEADAMQSVRPHWLAYCGPSGTGKTHLASALFKRLQAHFQPHPTLLSGAHRYVWPRLLPKLRDGAYWMLDDIRECNLLFLDDFGTERPTEFALEKLYEIIESRTRKWTILTSNLSVSQIGERMDTRIASRLIRDGSVVVDVQAEDFNLRLDRQK